MDHPELILIFFSIAFLYSTIGFGGGSSYLAILVLYGIEINSLRALALLCNIAVVSFGVYYYANQSLIDWKKLVPLVGLSVPFAFIGGRISLPKETFLVILGLTLLIAGIAVLIKKSLSINNNKAVKPEHLAKEIGIGGGIGFLSGLVGIGGGIFLSPLLHLMNWGTAKRIAAASSFFILVNSIAGLLGQYSQQEIEMNWVFVGMLLLAVIAGGQLGTRLGAQILSQNAVRKMTAVLVIYVGAKLVLENVFLFN